jgi:hypothetical protein
MKKQIGYREKQDKAADTIGHIADGVTTALTLAWPVGVPAQVAIEIGKMALDKMIRADYTQTKEREFKKAYKPIRNPRTGKMPNFWTGGWYARRKDATG